MRERKGVEGSRNERKEGKDEGKCLRQKEQEREKLVERKKKNQN